MRATPLALQGGIASDPELQTVWQMMEEAWRLEGQGRFVVMLAEKHALRPGMSFEEARDIAWTLCSLATMTFSSSSGLDGMNAKKRGCRPPSPDYCCAPGRGGVRGRRTIAAERRRR